MSSTKFLFNANIRHAHFTARFAVSEARGLRKAVVQSRRLTKRLLADKELSGMTRKQQLRLLTIINKEVTEVYKIEERKTFASMKDFSRSEQDFSLQMLDKGVEAPVSSTTARSTDKLVFGTPTNFGGPKKVVISSALRQFGRAKTNNILRAVSDGITQGQTNQQIRSGVNAVTSQLATRHADTLVRTIVNHVSTGSRDALYKKNRDIIKEVRWSSVLDGRTSEICQSLDGNVYPIDSGPRPPAHPNCRSTVVPVIKPEHDILPGIETKTTRFARGAEGKVQVGSKVSYGPWLKSQPAAFQNEVLGPARAALFRKGNLPIDKFVSKNLKPLNLKQLKRLHPTSFDKAGI